MEESILATIKKVLGIVDYDGFDEELVLSINSAFSNLNQLGVGPDGTYRISGVDDKWADFLETATDLEAVKHYLYLKVRLSFDPPTNSFLVDAITRQISELEWRLNVQVDT